MAVFVSGDKMEIPEPSFLRFVSVSCDVLLSPHGAAVFGAGQGFFFRFLVSGNTVLASGRRVPSALEPSLSSSSV
jgi:hypothetical protein